MKLLFPCHPLKARLPDPDYELEVQAAEKAGLECLFYNVDLLREGRAEEAIAKCPDAASSNERILHRGWMMTDDAYSQLYAELGRKGYTTLVTPEQYTEAHYLPNAYP